jgi:hypothetical protein
MEKPMPRDCDAGDGNDQFRNVLAECAAAYDDAETDDARREAELQQLMAIASALQHADIPAESLRPMTAIIHDLIDRKNKTESGGAPGIPFADARQRGLASIVVTLQMRGGKSESLALREVAKRTASWRAMKQRRRWNGKSRSGQDALKDWREKAMAGDRQKDIDANIYYLILDLAAHSGRPPLESADWFLTKAAKLYR